MLASLTVTSAADAGAGSLREAIEAANLIAGPDLIEFDSSLSGLAIQLTTDELTITDSLTIDASNLATNMVIDASLADTTPMVNDGNGIRIFSVNDHDHTSNIEVELRSLSLTGGDIREQGGAIYSFESLTLDDVLISGNHAAGGGGGITAVVVENGELILRNTRLTGNTAIGNGGGLEAMATKGSAVTIEGSYFGQNSSGLGGGGIAVSVSNGAELTANNSRFSNNSAFGGGGIWVRPVESTVNITENFVSDNSATLGGGIFSYSSHDSSVTVTNSIINHNEALQTGGGWYADSRLGGSTSAVSATIAGNSAGSLGGAMSIRSINDGSFQVEASDIVNNVSTSRGGGIFAQAMIDGTVEMKDSVVSGNTSHSDGGGLFLFSLNGSVSIHDSDILDNSATRGGGMYSQLDGGTGVLTDSTISGNESFAGGAGVYVYQLNASEATIADSQFLDNVTMDGVGGGLNIRSRGASSAAVSASTFAGNSALVGGGISARTQTSAAILIDRSTLENNSANHGGGLSMQPLSGTTVELRDSTILNNEGMTSAGGIFAIPSGGLANILNSTISGNSARNNGGGIVASAGGIGSLVRLQHSTVAFNEAGTGASSFGKGGGVYAVANAAELDHSIVSDNVAYGADEDLEGTFEATFSLVENIGVASVIGSDNLIGPSADLLPLADNGGPTLTHALNMNSPAINAGDASISGEPAFDQRGAPFDRVHFGQIDMGAFEFTDGPTGDFDADGDFDCDDIDALVALVASDAYISSFDMDLNGQLNLDDVDQWLAVAGAANLTNGNAFLPGDANLDGAVNGDDFLIWNAHKFSLTAAWCQGDFNADGSTDGNDFVIWNANKFTSPTVIAVPTSPAAYRIGSATNATETDHTTPHVPTSKELPELPQWPLTRFQPSVSNSPSNAAATPNETGNSQLFDTVMALEFGTDL
jgi:hypothetical protein